LAIGLLIDLGLLVPAFAQTTTPPPQGGTHSWGGGSMMHGRMPGVFGTVSAVSGSTLTLTSKARGSTTSGTTYTVDASSATVMKNGTTSSLSAIAVGDMVMVQGTVSGSNVTATNIRDGIPSGMPKGGMPRGAMQTNFQGNGQPIIGGAVSAVSGSALTVTTKSNVVYAVDASNATITKSGATSTIASITTGDNVIVQGTVNGTAVAASSIMDQGVTPAANNSAEGTESGTTKPGGMRFFGPLGGLFSGFLHLFGF